MIFSNIKNRFILGVALTAFSFSVFAAYPQTVPRHLIRHIESLGSYAIVTLSRDVANETNCSGKFVDSERDYTLRRPDRIKQFYIDIDNNRNNYMLIMTAAASRKRTVFKTGSCNNRTGLPTIISVETLF